MIYDLIILGIGPAGLAAALYAERSKLNTLLVGKQVGGYVVETPLIENYPGFKEISGMDLAKKMYEQVQAIDIKIEEEILEIKEVENEFVIKTNKDTYLGKTLILALGSKRRELGIKGEQEFKGKGITYCVLCDAPFFKDKDVAIIGGGDSAVIAALLMLKYANKIYMIDIEKKPRAKAFRLEQLKKEGKEKLEILSSHKVNEIKGKEFVNAIEIEEVEWQDKEFKETGQKKELPIQGIIIEIGMTPSTELVKQLDIKLDGGGFIVVDEEMKTNIKGIFAAGDITNRKLKQILTAAAQGATAAISAQDYIQEIKKRK
ncbi:MAG: FAD-dependent oxidoreductase [Candidatus Pacearchaeota archaeon]|nr:MAG: FAD-dependent oxidoreductase [Candidatus Pacearchaeota archaeon]